MLFNVSFVGTNLGIIVEADNMDIATAKMIMRKKHPILALILPIQFIHI